MRLFLWLYYLFVFFPTQVALSSVQVALAVLFPEKNVKPAIVAVPIDLKTDWGITLLANTITLTPGTLTLDVSQNKKFIFIHCLAVKNIEGFKKTIKNDFEKKIIRLEGRKA